MNINPIKTDAEYRKTLREIETLMSAQPGSKEGDRLVVLVPLVEAYQRIHFPMDLSDAVYAIKIRMDHQGLTIDDLVPAICRKNNVCEVLPRRLSQTAQMIQALNKTCSTLVERLLQ